MAVGWQTSLQGRVIFIRRTTEYGAVSLLGHTWQVDPHWCHRLVRCEVLFDPPCIRFYALRRAQPDAQPPSRDSVSPSIPSVQRVTGRLCHMSSITFRVTGRLCHLAGTLLAPLPGRRLGETGLRSSGGGIEHQGFGEVAGRGRGRRARVRGRQVAVGRGIPWVGRDRGLEGLRAFSVLPARQTGAEEVSAPWRDWGWRSARARLRSAPARSGFP